MYNDISFLTEKILINSYCLKKCKFVVCITNIFF